MLLTFTATFLSCLLLYWASLLDRKILNSCTYKQWKSLTKKRDHLELVGFVVALLGVTFWRWGFLTPLWATVFWLGLPTKWGFKRQEFQGLSRSKARKLPEDPSLE